MNARRRTRGGCLARLLVLLAVAGAFLTLGWMLLLPGLAASALQRRTGFEVAFRSLAVNPFGGMLRARGVVLENPPTFPAPEFLRFREFSADVEIASLFFGERTVIRSATLDVEALTLVRRGDGATNVELFRQYLARGGRRTEGAAASAKGAGRGYLIRSLELRCERLRLLDHTAQTSVAREIALNFSHTYTDVTRSSQLVVPALVQPLLEITDVLIALLPADLGAAVAESGRRAAESAGEAARRSAEGVKGFLDKLEETRNQ